LALSIDQFARMSRLLDEALALDAEQRREWLAALPAADHDLAPALQAVLFPDQKVRGFLDQFRTLARFEPGADMEAAGPAAVVPGERVGPYELERRLGAGGMAEVWLARRADGAYQRQVALKLPKLDRLRRDLAQRFAYERDILAGLEHVHIARFYDAGVRPDGLPYLAMEYVPGQPLTDWCDAQRLGIRKRIELFLQVLDAMQYAHDRQVVHRDIKPSNILVTESGQVRLLDFGVAKLLADADRTDLTRVYGRALTPDYASPEHLLGDEADVASDVFSLGVVLHELLTGNRPDRLLPATSQELRASTAATVPIQRPSTRLADGAAISRSTTQPDLAKGLRGDLDAIVVKSIRPAPAQRYASAAELAQDLRRYLAGEPVLAQPDSVAYRTAKFARRHRPVLATLAAAAVAGVAVAMLAPVRRPVPPVDAVAAPAAAVAQKSIAVLPFVDMSEKKDQEYFSDGLSEELISHLARMSDLKVIARTSSFQFKGKSEDVRSIGKRLGVAYILEGSVRKAGRDLRITAQLVRAADGAQSWSQTYERNLADIFTVQDEIAGTVARALQGAMTAGVRRPQAATNVDAYNAILKADFLWNRSMPGDGERALALYREATRLDPGYAPAWARLGQSYHLLGYYGERPVAQARREALDAVQRALAIDPDLSDAHRALGGIDRDFDWNWKEAKREFARAAELDPNDRASRADLGYLTWMETGRIDGEIDALREELLRDPLATRSLWLLGISYWAARRYPESIQAYVQLQELNPGFGGAAALHAQALLFDGQLERALAVVQREPQEEMRLSVLPCLYWRMNRPADSDRAMQNQERRYGSHASEYFIARSHACRGENPAALDWLELALQRRLAGVQNVKFDPYFDALRKEPRFQRVLVAMRLDEPAVAASP
jgi:serine/threonine-protein kinase